MLTKVSQTIAEGADADEIFSVVFSYPLYDMGMCETENFHVIGTSEPQLSVDKAFSSAAAIFHKICPGAEFLGMSKQVDDVVRERIGDYVEDEEGQFLETAAGMVEDQAANDKE